ncbi:MAG: 3-deoxy-8-phosphooctulonate synthase [Holosporales bacterium]|jgi:2-dehydro-3-deoxyphosphooctonate aldolase (KDO 8-P synthase)|nr:3-deoxy-8-phosphooctulonate synthase [Holosporales bacterium]
MKTITINNVDISNDLPFVFIGGPCVIESEDHPLFICEKIKNICDKLKIQYIFKSSFDKANRTNFKGKRGVGIDKGLKILEKVKNKFNVPILTDVHLPDQCKVVAEVTDILQIPAFLSRQTDLLEAAGKTGKIINVKKAQFMAPNDMENVISKITSTGNDKILLCDRGTCFGYNNLVSDFRALPIMTKTEYPVVFDATHSIQLPSANGTCSGGERDFAAILARAAIAVGVAGIFMEVHDEPEKALCDGPNMIRLSDLEQVLLELLALDKISKQYKRRI